MRDKELINNKEKTKLQVSKQLLVLKVHECRFENLPISSTSCENNMLKI